MPLVEKTQNTATYHEWIENISSDVPVFDPQGYVPGLDGPTLVAESVRPVSSPEPSNASVPTADTASGSDSTHADTVEDNIEDNVSVNDADDTKREDVVPEAVTCRSDKSAWSRTSVHSGWGNYPTGVVENGDSDLDSDSSEFEFLVPDVQLHQAVLDK